MEIQSTQSFLEYFGKIRGRTMRVIGCVPRDRLEWTHHEGKWSFADLIRHIAATERHMFAENVQGNPSRYPGCGPDLADGYDAVMRYIEDMHAESMEIFGALTDEDLLTKCPTPGGVEMSTWKWLRAMVEHEVHHRGQVYLMLGMLEIETPPLYGLTSEEVYERSGAHGNRR